MESQALNELQRSLGRIEGKQDALLLNQDRLREDYDKVKADVSSVKTEVNNLRFRLNWYAGSLATAGALALFFKDRILHLVTG